MRKGVKNLRGEADSVKGFRRLTFGYSLSLPREFEICTIILRYGKTPNPDQMKASGGFCPICQDAYQVTILFWCLPGSDAYQVIILFWLAFSLIKEKSLLSVGNLHILMYFCTI